MRKYVVLTAICVIVATGTYVVFAPGDLRVLGVIDYGVAACMAYMTRNVWRRAR